MADDKITIVTLRKLLAQKAGIKEEVAGAFLTHLFPAIIAGLRQDKVVRVSGLGTFKLQWNDPRKSVNVQTGEAIIIEGYNKVVFVPETDLREQINEPFAHLEPIVIDGETADENGAMSKETPNPMQRFADQAAEIKDILAELGAVEETTETMEEDNAETPEEENTDENEEEMSAEETEEAEEIPAEEEVVMQEEPLLNEENTQEQEPEQEQPQDQIEETPQVQPESEDPIIEPKEEPITAEVKGNQPKKRKKKEQKPFNAWLVAGITILIFCVLLVIGFFVAQQKLVEWANSLLEPQPATVETIQTAIDEVSTPADTLPISTDEIVAKEDKVESIEGRKEQAEEPLNRATPASTSKRSYTQFIKTETLTEGSRLTWLSRKYYGAPDFWVYIYEANQDKLSDPNQIPVGTEIRIPKLPASLIDKNNPACIEQARALHDQILGNGK